MARAVNKAILVGNLGDDPDLRYTNSGTAVCNMSLATNKTYTNNDGEEVQQTEWHDVVAWGRLAEVCAEYLSKGSQVYFEGPIQTREYEDRDGNTRYNTEVKAQEMMFLDSNRQGGGVGATEDRRGGSPATQQQDPSSGTPEMESSSSQEPPSDDGEETFEPDDELPF